MEPEEPIKEIKAEPIDVSYYEDKIDRARVILEKEFAREVQEREDQVIHIQSQIHLAQKNLQLIRYVTSCDYYDIKEEIKQESKDFVQSAIHPCVKKLLPNPMGPQAGPSKIVHTIDDNFHENNRKISKETENKVEISVNNSNLVKKPNVTIVRGTYRVNHQIIIGNVSKSLAKTQREDEATHKWMMYLRYRDDSKKDLGQIIKKVRYYLHDSYKPNDIIDVTTAPFHLTRRGWGEFPVRVTLYFHHPSNKPTDVIHQLKLDNTEAGQQMLGGETVVELNLIHENMEDFLPKNTSPKKFQSKLGEIVAAEHDYCAPEGHKTVEAPKPSISNSLVQMLPDRLDNTEINIINQWDEQKDGPIREWHRKSLLEITSRICFLSTEVCVKWLLKRWPIVTPYSSIENYRTIHPYTFSNMADFYKANMGKKHASEFYRAWKIKSVLESLNMAQWTSKQILMYSRMHGYVHFLGKQYHSVKNQKFSSTFTNQLDTSSNLRALEINIEDEIDILGDEPKKSKLVTPSKSCKSVNVVSGFVKFVDFVNRDIGIRLQEEEIVEGVTINASSAVLGQVLKIFVEDLLRKSLSNAWIRNKCRSPLSLEVSDIVKCLVDNPQFDIFTNVGLGSKND